MAKQREEEFGRFVAARGPSLCRTAYLLTGDWQVGEDLVQEALTRTYLHRRRLRSPEALEPYARKVLVSLFLTSPRRLWRWEPPFANLPGHVPHGRRPALKAVSPQQRAVLVLRYFDELTDVEIAAVLGRSPGAVNIEGARGMREELRARLEAAEARQADRPPAGQANTLAERIRRARLRRRLVAGIGALAIVAAVAIPMLQTQPRTHNLVHKTAAGLPLSDPAVTPGGWAAVAYGDAQISVPVGWRIGGRVICGRAVPGYVVLGSAATSLVARNPRCKQAPDMAAIQLLTDHRDQSPRWSGQINGIRVYLVQPPARGFVSYLVPALHAVVTARGPLADRVLATLTPSPLAVVLAPGPQLHVPSGWRWHYFGGIRFATPGKWRVLRSRLWFSCWDVVYPALSVELVSATRRVLMSCSVPQDIAGFMGPSHGVAVGFGKYAGLYDTAREIGCRSLHRLRACLYSPSAGRPLELAVYVPGQRKPTVVDVGLRGSGLEARLIVQSIGPG